MKRTRKNKPFPFFFSKSGRGSGGSRQKIERKWICFFRTLERRATAWGCGASPRTRMCTQKYKITTRSARCNHCPFSKWVRAKVSISAQNDTSSEVRPTTARAAGAVNGNKTFLSATKWLGDGTEKRTDLSLVSYPKIIFQNYDQTKIFSLCSQEHRR